MTQHGGARKGAGRKAQYAEPTKVLRVPASRILEIKNFLQQKVQPNRPLELKDIRQFEARTTLHIPLAAEKISAGFPSPAQDYISDHLDLNQHLIHNATTTFIIRVASQSMLHAGIDIDDELIVDRSLTARHHDIVIALIDNEFTVKRLMIEPQQRWLKAENPDYSDIHLKDGQELLIWGVVTNVIKKLR
ncbi:LexA family protein [Acinetobacter larvae]|uniref:DNA polymerase V n=1 Tax=Acinetobacter larvae TaxID=1789224 RepID=A0A1B2M1A2_9GAMM|nr:translesion error-prone DNA polymerase V autoproteolytic subunit [Acinetobacter larvae]AOA58955.1 DNA polymerase V [Acinetobacter larvae]